jgi:predicted negative regulator of RcsB-dependent stress response
VGRKIIAFSIVAVAAAGPARSQASMQPTPAALQIFERDWVLMNWALKYYDANGDILLEPGEAQAAAEAFRKLADVDRDGRVTQEEYRAAREFILARY